MIPKLIIFLLRVVKDLQQWNEAPLDCVVLSLYQLQAYYCNEIKRGLSGLGTYTIAPEYSSLQLDQFDEKYLPANSPDDIVKQIRDDKSEEMELCVMVHCNLCKTVSCINCRMLGRECRHDPGEPQHHPDAGLTGFQQFVH